MLKIELLPSDRGPGFAILSIPATLGPGAALAIQRNQDQKFLAEGGTWTSTQFWHDLSRMSPAGEGVQAEVGPALVDSMLASPNLVYLGQVKRDGSTAAQPARVLIKSGVLSSSAMGKQAAIIDSGYNIFAGPPAAPLSEPVAEPEPAPVSETAEQEEVPSPPPLKEKAGQGGLSPLVLGLIGLAVLLLAGLAVWWFFLRGGGAMPPSDEPAMEDMMEPSADEAVVDDASQTSSPQMACDVSGATDATVFLQSCVSSEPDADTVIATAGAAEDAGQCEIVRRLLTYVSQKGQNEVAMHYAQQFDPDGFTASACFAEADAETAAYWYEGPAANGNVLAQRQLGKLLTADGPDGLEYNRGVELLDEAAAAGDAEAAQALEELETN